MHVRLSAGTLQFMMTSADLGNLIRERRRSLRVSQEDFGAVVGVAWDQTRVSRYERGRIPPEAADQVAKVINWTAQSVRDVLNAGLPAPVTEPSFAERLDTLEEQMDGLRADVEELLRSPRRAAGRAQNGSRSAGR